MTNLDRGRPAETWLEDVDHVLPRDACAGTPALYPDRGALAHPAEAEAERGQLSDSIGADVGRVTPGSDAAHKLKEDLVRRRLWSQYLEAGDPTGGIT